MSGAYDDLFISFIHQQVKEAKVKHEKKQSKYHDDSREYAAFKGCQTDSKQTDLLTDPLLSQLENFKRYNDFYESRIEKEINSELRPVCTGKKLQMRLKLQKLNHRWSISNALVVYECKCDLCDADYVGYTRRHLFQSVDEHKHSGIGKHLRDVHSQTRIKIYVTNLPSKNAVESWIT